MFETINKHVFKELNILRVFIEEASREFNVREVARLIKIAPATASKELKKFANLGILTSRKERRHDFYKANSENELFKDLRSFYHARKIKPAPFLEAPAKRIEFTVAEAIKEKKSDTKEWALTGVTGFDDLLDKGFPRGTSSLLCGGPGTGKTIMGLQICNYAANKGEKCLYMTFEESPERLKKHMKDFGFNVEELEKKGLLVLQKVNPFDITRQVTAMLERAKGELLIDIKPLIFPKGFTPDRVIIDSLTAISSAFYGKEENYRIYIEQLFNLLEESNVTSFLVSERTYGLNRLTTAGVEEFLADGVIILYNVQRGTVRESAIEILKIRGAKFEKKVVAMKITDQGIVVYPEQEVFGQVGGG
ncbi:AAA family ATPase [Candidatus Woesearchaeota archaeon]|nr:AAA family ATPase [Candidatus Woesearchaeota archaeon]